MKPIKLFFIVLAAISLLSTSAGACGPCISDADCLVGELCIAPGIGSSNWCCPPLGSWCDSNAACCWHSNATEWHCSWCHWNYSCTLGPNPHYATCQDHCTVHWGCICMNCPPDLYTSCCTPFCEGHKQCHHYCNNPNFDACALGNLSGCCGGKSCDCVIGACGATCLDGQTRPCSGINETWTDYCNGEHFIEYNGSGVNGSVTVTCNSTQTCSDCVWPSTCCDLPNATSKDWGLCDESMQSCTICCNAGWNLGGEVDPTACCGDDSGEFERTRQCISGCTADNSDDACCDASNKCVYSSVCYDDNACFGNLKCNSGSWEEHCFNGVQDCNELEIDCSGEDGDCCICDGQSCLTGDECCSGSCALGLCMLLENLEMQFADNASGSVTLVLGSQSDLVLKVRNNLPMKDTISLQLIDFPDLKIYYWSKFSNNDKSIDIEIAPDEEVLVPITVFAGQTGTYRLKVFAESLSSNSLTAHGSRIIYITADKDPGLFSRSPGLSWICLIIIALIGSLVLLPKNRLV